MSFPKVLDITTAGAAGSATGTGTTGVAADRLVAVEVERKTAGAATMDVTITNRGRTVLTLTNLAADTMVHPLVQGVDAAGAPVAASWVPPMLDGTVSVAVAQANAGACTVRLYFE
jgi:hypothetical protein